MRHYVAYFISQCGIAVNGIFPFFLENGLYRGCDTLEARPLKNAPFRPISALHSDFNPRNMQDIPVVKILMRLDLERN